MPNIVQMKKIIQLITRDISFGQDVYELVFGDNVTDLDFGVQIDPVNVRPWNMSHCETSTFDNHFDYRSIVLKDTQQSTGTRMCCIWWNVVDGNWNDVNVLELDGVVRAWFGSLQRVSLELLLGLFNLVRYGMKYFNH